LPTTRPPSSTLFPYTTLFRFKDVYRYDLTSNETFRLTNLATGVSGITALSPAMSVAMQSGRMMFSVFSNNRYTVFSKEASELEGERVVEETEGIASVGVLPPIRAVNQGLVEDYLDSPLTGLPPGDTEYEVRNYSARLRL